eukprot:scaffold5956_cov155-Skeletonema_menzelii.AAC.7
MIAHFFLACLLQYRRSTWRDVSQVRQVPDNQEVYQDCSEESGAVVVIEILEHQTDVKNEDASTFFFNDLADTNGVSQDDITIQSNNLMFALKDDNATKQKYFQKWSLSSQQSESYACISVGKQQVGDKSLRIEMCVLRLTDVTTDLLITLSTPDNKKGSVGEDGLSNVFREILSTFCIIDWNLFC